MTRHRTIAVQQYLDVIVARSCARDVARTSGLGITDQARISLATSCLAQALGLGVERSGQFTIDGVAGEERAGVRVVCTTTGDTLCPVSRVDTWSVKSMVDELTIEELEQHQLRVTIVKWAT